MATTIALDLAVAGSSLDLRRKLTARRLTVQCEQCEKGCANGDRLLN